MENETPEKYGKWAKVEAPNPGGSSQPGVTPATPQSPDANGGSQVQSGNKSDEAVAAPSGTFAKTADGAVPAAGIAVTLGVLALVVGIVAARRRNRA